MARKFLYVFAILIGLVIVGAFAYRLFGVQLMRAAMVPSAPFEAPAAAKADAYAPASMWIARPDIAGNPSLWVPPSVVAEPAGKAAIFFIHPTSYLSRTAWNAPLDDQDANDRAALFVRGQASVFNAVGEVWAPRYRQATFGAFLTSEAAAGQALGAAYQDVLAAFDSFIASIPKDQPIILAGHSQGALHLMRLLKERVAGQPLAARIAAAYVVGWPVSVMADLPALGLPACAQADDSGCILSWQSFAEPAEPEAILTVFDATKGLTGAPRKDSAMLCTNPLTGIPDSSAAAAANLGTTIPSADFKTATLVKAAVPARCDGRGFLLIGAPPEMGPYVLPGNNYHVYDYSLFWANIRADAGARLASFAKK
jgi:Protein of unknown function (DUF3089)